MNEQFIFRAAAYLSILIVAWGYAQSLVSAVAPQNTGGMRILQSLLRVGAVGLLFLQLLLYLPQIDLILGGILFIGTVWIRSIRLLAYAEVSADTYDTREP